MSVKVKADDLLRYAAEKIKGTDDTLAHVGTLVAGDRASLTLPVNTPSNLTIVIPEDGTYVVTASNIWQLSNSAIITTMALLHNNGNPMATAQGTMSASHGLNVTTIINAKKNDTATLQIAWGGGSGSATAERIRFRAVRVGGGNRIKRLIHRIRKAVMR